MNDQDLHSKALRVFETIVDNLNNHNMRFQKDEENLRIVLFATGDDLMMPILFEVLESRQVMRILSPMPFKMPEDKRIDGAVVVSIANYGIVNGSFDYDIRDGEIRFRCTTAYHDTEVSDEMITYMMAISLQTTDRYNDRFQDVALGKMDVDGFMKADGQAN